MGIASWTKKWILREAPIVPETDRVKGNGYYGQVHNLTCEYHKKNLGRQWEVGDILPPR